MADQTVPEQSKHYRHADAINNLRHAAKAASIVKAVSLAVAAQAETAVKDEDMRDLTRWAPSVKAALLCIQRIEASFLDTVDSPSSVDWSTPLSLLEAMTAVFWSTGVPEENAMCCWEIENLCEAVQDALSTLHDDLSSVASGIAGRAILNC